MLIVQEIYTCLLNHKIMCIMNKSISLTNSKKLKKIKKKCLNERWEEFFD